MNELVIETAGVAFATFFATIGPVEAAAMYAALRSAVSRKRRRQMAVRGTLIAGSILLLFALVGDFLLAGLGISLAALRTGGGILLLLIGIDLVFARSSGSTSTTDEEEKEAQSKQDISVFPLATPLIAGPGALGAVILLMANAEGEPVLQAAVIASLIAILLVTLAMLILASEIQQFLGVTGMHVVTRIFGVLLSALAVQFIFDGIAASGLLAGVAT